MKYVFCLVINNTSIIFIFFKHLNSLGKGHVCPYTFGHTKCVCVCRDRQAERDKSKRQMERE